MARNPRVKAEEDTEPETDSEEDAEEETDSEEDIIKLLEPFTKLQLIDIFRSLSTNNKGIISEIQQQADQNPSHLKIFVHGLPLETTSDDLKEIFSSYGEIEDCNVVTDKGRSGRCYGFILYKHRKSVVKALKEPIKKIGNRFTACNLASSGPIHVPQLQRQNSTREEILQRKIFVGNVNDSHFEITGEKLYSFFSKYGEIEAGPLGYDFNTGRFKGYALFIYKTVEGATRALEEPIKNFNGHPLYCEMAADDYRVDDTSCQIGTSGHGLAKPPALARAGECLASVGYYLDKLILFLLFFVGVLFLLCTVF
ncbi:hypothetical protein MKW94_013708 [Papaver nudicaule]|uniref:RRM domain-containing protein n=1 Tax=Papaver nudicaule TaxID=74823 RepID=A0AA42B3F4_PAPNU|nr:hypothetical protein [Papaver nudicaule]